MAAGLVWGAGGLAGVALLAGWRDRRGRLRTDPDRVSPVDWPTVQMLALVALLIVVSLAFNA